MWTETSCKSFFKLCYRRPCFFFNRGSMHEFSRSHQIWKPCLFSTSIQLDIVLSQFIPFLFEVLLLVYIFRGKHILLVYYQALYLALYSTILLYQVLELCHELLLFFSIFPVNLPWTVDRSCFHQSAASWLQRKTKGRVFQVECTTHCCYFTVLTNFACRAYRVLIVGALKSKIIQIKQARVNGRSKVLLANNCNCQLLMVQAEMYTKLFSKPPMTEKLLSRPPFKYLFDVVFALIKTTGFAEGLFSESELDASIYTVLPSYQSPNQSKEPKLKFLQKIIDCVQIVNGAKLDVKATKIVAGQEPEKTNEWLQAMFVAATSKKDFRPAVKQVLTGEAPPAPEPKKEEKPKPKEVKEPPKPKESAKAPPKAEVPPEEPPKKPKQAEEKPKKKPKQEEPPEPARPKTPPSIVIVVQFCRGSEAQGTRAQVQAQGQRGKACQTQNGRTPQLRKSTILLIKKFIQPRANPNINLGQVDPSQHGAFVKQAVEDIKAAEEKRVIMKLQNKQKKAETTEAEPKPEVKEKSKIKMGRLGGKSKVEKRTAEVKEHMIPKANVDDMEYLRNVIQTMTKTIAPLGKSMDFISEDVETMTKEYEAWRNRSQSAKTQLEEELRRTEDILQPLQDKLAEIEGQIQEQKEKIHNTKSQIFKNEGIIQGLLASVIAKQS
eukprot:TRINITY_DN119_c2_g2_i1.p1 TRINITY_DN119_c2_g2~~TRINITY_DN119_c2_g2_i1.p1  ORF type:complete len:662 (-),score=27.35 TRINITY_DN119_c2_g2_i1:1561-3546(-)